MFDRWGGGASKGGGLLGRAPRGVHWPPLHHGASGEYDTTYPV